MKDIFRLDNGNLLFHFSDRISAFDVQMTSTVPRKGQVLCRFGEFWFKSLRFPHHMVGVTNETAMEVKRLEMIPLECVVRGYLYGSLYDRQCKQTVKDLRNPIQPKASRLPRPIFDPTTKSQDHDVPITRNDAIRLKHVSGNDYDYLEEVSIKLYERMSKIVESKGFIIADVKFEFGKEPKTGDILLGDSIGPDEFRLWLRADYSPGEDQGSFDKQVLRDWLIKTGFRNRVELSVNRGSTIDAPPLPGEIVTELTRRYVWAYEKITCTQLNHV